MMEISNKLIGKSTGKRDFQYTWRDVVLYALGVGAKAEELIYLYEKQLKAIPTFGTVPYWGTFGITPYTEIPQNAVRSLGLDLTGSLHMTHEIIIHKPIEPMGAHLKFEDMVTNIYDWNGKNAVVETTLTAFDLNHEKVFTNIGQIYLKQYTASAGVLFPKTDVIIPDTSPDFISLDYIPGNQSMLYRLSGDTNRTHIDYDYAVRLGHPKQLIQGLCTFGYACRLAIQKLIPGEPERMTRFGAQIRNAMYPDTDIRLEIWKVEERKGVFRLINNNTGKAALDKGVIEWK